jgi:hypothetical protein
MDDSTKTWIVAGVAFVIVMLLTIGYVYERSSRISLEGELSKVEKQLTLHKQFRVVSEEAVCEYVKMNEALHEAYGRGSLSSAVYIEVRRLNDEMKKGFC